MNPSAPDWIQKFLNRFDKVVLIENFGTEAEFYQDLKRIGFVYGLSEAALPQESLSNLKLTREEFTKVNLFHCLLFQYFQAHNENSFDDAVKTILSFYKQLEKGKTGFFQKLSLTQSPSNNLENILAARLQEANTLLKKNTISLLTYALLFLDVLTFRYWLRKPDSAKEYYKEIEKAVLTACFFTLKSKFKKNKYDKLLIDLFESSSEYWNAYTESNDIAFLKSLNYIGADAILEKKYIQDLCCLTIWEDLKLDENEYQFLKKLNDTLEIPEISLQESLLQLKHFSEKHTEKLHLFEYSHPVKQFYKQSSATVKLLIIRNKDRLARELEESGELVILLRQSTKRDLTTAEKSKVKEQLLDICKSIPSLTIFLLPGGSVLLPLLVKFIPKLLPSSFHDNRI
ncbi:LETM1-related biofilm-associated protein [Aequorivita echinoideorum]|uniref:Letm1 RBD domain-containing protein n=1 Tax=Aequorivita echinoideorum TaxID=1549647 RepID=A0ABS5S610_9FLAO|nr:LETM1-related biofilm-associated protein [Aequorivita echinoideorum]MBT0608418.1 hypothetical protein [Aequorivita echinoideorum]